MIPSWLAISTVALLVAIAINKFFPTEYRWFNRLRRPDWLTFERAIPLIWTFIFILSVWFGQQLLSGIPWVVLGD
ncbi:MAG: hypothetical protein RLZZ148_2947 [Cyanobacteriota bacterium]